MDRESWCELCCKKSLEKVIAEHVAADRVLSDDVLAVAGLTPGVPDGKRKLVVRFTPGASLERDADDKSSWSIGVAEGFAPVGGVLSRFALAAGFALLVAEVGWAVDKRNGP